MWRYRKPSFELLLLGELQRQQRSSILCDTILQADGISVPAHSCVLSAMSPQFSHTLSAAPPLPLGKSHILQIQAVRAHTLLKLVGFLYSGELEGSGERERKELITAAWKLGIEGLEEVGRKEGEMQEKHNRRVTEDAKDCEDDSGEVKELGRRWEESEGLIEETDGMRAPGMMKDKGMQTESPKNRQGVSWMTGVGDSGGEEQDMNTESSYVPLPKKARDSETQTEVSEMTVGGADMETQTVVSVLRIIETDTGTQRDIPVWMDRETDTGTPTDIPVWMDRETDTGTQRDIPVWMDRERHTGTQRDIPVWMDRERETGTQTDIPVWMDRETDTGTPTDIPVWMDRETDTGTPTEIPVWMDRETDTGTPTDIPVWMDRETDTGTQRDIPVWMDRETDTGTQRDIPVWMDRERHTGTQRDIPVWMDRERETGTQTDIPVWMDRETDTGTQRDIPVWMDRETDTGTQRDIPVWMDRETDTGTQRDIPVWMDRERDTGTQTDIPVSMDRERDTGTQTDIPVWMDRETDTGTQRDIPVWMDRETDTGTQRDIPVWMDRERHTGTQTDIPVWMDRQTDTCTQTDIPVLMDRETDTGTQTDIPVWMDRERHTGTQTDIPVWMDRERDTGTQTLIPVSMDRETNTSTLTDLPVWRKRWTEADDGDTSILPLPPMPACSTSSSEWSVKPLAFCIASWPQQLSPVSGGPLYDREDTDALLLAGEGGAQLANAGHVTHRRNTPPLASHTIADTPLTNISFDKSSSVPASVVTNPPSSTVSPEAPFTANITAETDGNSPTLSISAPAVTPASALSAHHSDTVAPAPLIIAHHTDSIAPTEIIASDTDIIVPAPTAAAAQSASLMVTAGVSGGSDVRLLSVSEAARSSSSAADQSPVAPVTEVMAQHCMALPTNPRIPLPHTSLLPPSGDCCSSPCTFLTIHRGADLEDPGGRTIQSSTSPACILSQGLCDCSLIPAASPMLAQVEEHHPSQTSSFPPVQAGMDFQGAIATGQKNTSAHFRSRGGKIVGDGVQELDVEENSEFERFEDNIAGFINHFLNPNPSQEESAHAGVGTSNVTGHQEMAPSGPRKRGRSRKGGRPRTAGMVRTEVVMAEGEQGNPSSLERGRGRERIEFRPKSPQKAASTVPRRDRGRGRGGGRGGIRDRQQPIKMRLKKQPEGGVWEIVDVRAEAFGAPRRRRGRSCKRALGGQEHTQDAFPIIKRQRCQPRVHPFRISSLPSQVFNALVSLPDLAEVSICQSPFQSGCGWHPRQGRFRALLPPPSPQATPEESAEQFEKLLDDMVGLVMGLDDSAEGGTANLLQPHPVHSAGPHVMDVVSPGSCLPSEVVINTSPSNVTPAMAFEGDFTVTADPVSLQSVTAAADASVLHTKTPVPLPEPHQGTTTPHSHGCCSTSLYSVCSHPHDEAAPFRQRSWSSSNPVSFCSESGKESIVGPKDPLPSCFSQAAGVTVSGLAYGLLQTATADSETPVRCSTAVQPNPRSGSNTERAWSLGVSHSTGCSRATDTSLYSPPQETTTAVNDILEHILWSSGNESESRCVNDGDEPAGILREDGAEVQEEATTPDVFGEHSSKDTRDVNGSKDADGLLRCSEGSPTKTQQLQEHVTPLTNVLSPVQKELTLEPEQPIKTSQDTSHIRVESQISSSAIQSKQQSSKDLSCRPSPSPEGLQIPSLMSEHLPADSSPKRLQSPVTKQPVPTDCSKRPTGVPEDKGALDNRLGGREKVDAEYKKKKIVTRSQTKKNGTKEVEDGKGQTSSNWRKQSAKRGLHNYMPIWERHADGTVVKRLRRSASWCEEENSGKLRDNTFRYAEKRKWEGQTTGVNLRKAGTSVYCLTNRSTWPGKKPGNFAVKREARYSSARVCISCTEKSPLDKLGKLDSYVNRLTKAKTLANKPMRSEYGTRNPTYARKHKADGVGKGGPSKRDTSEKMCKPPLITQGVKIPRDTRAEASSTLGKSTVSCWKAKRYQVVSERKMGDLQTDEGRLHTRARKRRMQDAMELKTRQGPPDKRRGVKPICNVCPQQPSLDLLQKGMKQRPKERISLLRGGKAYTMRDDSRPLNSSGVQNVRELMQRKRRVIECRQKENHREGRAGKEEQEEREDCKDGGATADEQDCLNVEEVTVQGDKGHGQILESRERDGETKNKEVPTEHGGAYGTDGEVGETGLSEMDRVDKPEADRPKGEREDDEETTSPSGTEIQDVSKGNSVISGLAASSQTPQNVTRASVGCLESEGEVDVEVDVLEGSSPIYVSFDALYSSAALGSNDADPFEVDAGEEDDEGQEVDVTGEESE